MSLISLCWWNLFGYRLGKLLYSPKHSPYQIEFRKKTMDKIYFDWEQLLDNAVETGQTLKDVFPNYTHLILGTYNTRLPGFDTTTQTFEGKANMRWLSENLEHETTTTSGYGYQQILIYADTEVDEDNVDMFKMLFNPEPKSFCLDDDYMWEFEVKEFEYALDDYLWFDDLEPIVNELMQDGDTYTGRGRELHTALLEDVGKQGFCWFTYDGYSVALERSYLEQEVRTALYLLGYRNLRAN